MSLNVLKDIRAAYSNLNPESVRKHAQQDLRIRLIADSETVYSAMERLLVPFSSSTEQRARGMAALQRSDAAAPSGHFDFTLCQQGLPCPANSVAFYSDKPEQTLDEVLQAHPDLDLPLACTFSAFRRPAIDRIIHKVSRDNGLFAVVTALPNFVPSLFELPWSVGEFATDTAFLTINQIRMAFLIAAANDKPIGLAEQKAEIAMIVAGAFGWRAIARELVGKIPLGGGLIPKGAVAYAGTYVVGQSLEAFHRTGFGLNSRDRKNAYQNALEKGRAVANSIVAGLHKRRSSV